MQVFSLLQILPTVLHLSNKHAAEGLHSGSDSWSSHGKSPGPSSRTESTDCETESPWLPHDNTLQLLSTTCRKEKPPRFSCNETSPASPALSGWAELACPPSEGLHPVGEEEDGYEEKGPGRNHKHKHNTIEEQENTVAILRKNSNRKPAATQLLTAAYGDDSLNKLEAQHRQTNLPASKNLSEPEPSLEN